MQIKIGADPEVFMKKDGEYISAHGVIPGDKKNPHRVDKGAVQVDGMALEFNIDPAESEEEFCVNIETVMAQLVDMLPEGSAIDAIPTCHFGKEYIAEQPEEAKELGCDPDFNAYTGEQNDIPDVDLPFRTGAGHVHIGWTEGAEATGQEHMGMCQQLIRQLDYYLGVPSILFDRDTDRREMYGAAGAFRPKSYGVEYRVLSNAWLKRRELTAWVYRATCKAVEDLINGVDLFEKYGDPSQHINTSNVEFAKEIIEKEGWEVPNV